MRIEIRDKDKIWSSSTIVQVHNGKSLDCTVRYDGWGPEWDEVHSWDLNANFAQLPMFTKRCLCIANMSSDKSQKRYWPCIVNIRMPDPRCDDDAYEAAEEELRVESRVFIQPYEPHLLPKYITAGAEYGGFWLDRQYVKEWLDISNIHHECTFRDFSQAYDIALKDKKITYTLPKDAFEYRGGSLVNRAYRVMVEGRRYNSKKSSTKGLMKKVPGRDTINDQKKGHKTKRCQVLEKDLGISKLQFPDSNMGGEKIGELRITKVRLSSQEVQPNTFLYHLLGNRIKVIDVPLNKNEKVPYEVTFHQNGNDYELISIKVQSDNEINVGFHSQAKCARLVYAQISGPGMETVDVQDWLSRLADFQSLTPRKLVARLELLQSPLYKFPSGEFAMFPIPKREFKDIEEEGHVGCGFICNEMLDELMGSRDAAKKVICLQVRIYIPTMGIYKGMLMRKKIDSGPRILMPSSMKKVEGSKHPERDDSAFMVVTQAGVDQSKNNVYMGRLLSVNKDADRPPASFQPKKLSSMITRLFEALGAPKDMVKDYAQKSGRYSFDSDEIDCINHAYVRGVIDPTGQLPSGHVFLTGVRNEDALGDELFVTRSPCIQVDDARMLNVVTEQPECMDDDSWEFLQELPFGAIIFPFPEKGKKSLPECIANGDLDGDRYFCCWNKDILSHIEAVPISEEELLAEESEEAEKEVIATPSVTTPCDSWWKKGQDRMSDIVAIQDMGKLISKLYTLSTKCADDNEEQFMRDNDAQHFARSFVYALENGKHGTKIELPLYLHEKVPPNLRHYLAVPSSNLN